MNMNKKILAATILTACIFGALFAYSLQRHAIRDTQELRFSANVYVTFQTSYGTWTEHSHNLITDIGEDYVRDIICFDNVTAQNATQWIALGNSSILQTRTKLGVEATSLGFTRALATATKWENGTDPAGNFTKKFTASGTIRVNATSINWSGTSNSDNNCYALDSITATTFNLNDNCTITWVLTKDGN